MIMQQKYIAGGLHKAFQSDLAGLFSKTLSYYCYTLRSMKAVADYVERIFCAARYYQACD